MRNLLFKEVWAAIEAYAEAMADGSLENPETKVHREIAVNLALYNLIVKMKEG